MTPEEEAERAHEILGGNVLLKCEVCGEAIPWYSQVEDEYQFIPSREEGDGPRWVFAHEAVDGFPDCVGVYDNRERKMSATHDWDRVRDNNAEFIKPTAEALARARRIKRA